MAERKPANKAASAPANKADDLVHSSVDLDPALNDEIEAFVERSDDFSSKADFLRYAATRLLHPPLGRDD